MLDAIELLKSRRSVPANALAEPAPSAEELDTMLTIAARVPDHGKLAPWRFIVIEGPARAELGGRLAELMKASDPEAPAGKVEAVANFCGSALIVAVVSRAGPHVKIPEWEQELSAGAVCMNLSIAVNALGYGAQWLTGWAAYDPKAREVIGLQQNERIAGFIHIGTPTERWTDRPRPELSEVVTRWGA
ncbi:nitroreductase [Chelatococcus sambhunathii]|uniref:Putative NAD(P)H nitroreductase n=1 Tax=Chelatococcus sambhunathii TaxID=363953 RepID=A0ABU1DA60_9HYPH|nr:nitroreductase [Chelatococcus sambhunathii]MDR4305013.1 nitroreductase [Chelatococcus sambhunathii]